MFTAEARKRGEKRRGRPTNWYGNQHGLWLCGNPPVGAQSKQSGPGISFIHHLRGDASKLSKLLGGVTAQSLTPNPSLDSGHQRRGERVGKKRVLLVAGQGHPRIAHKLVAVVFQNGSANGDAFIANVTLKNTVSEPRIT
jgi:hypothetical protein